MSTVRSRRQFSKEFKLQVLREIEAGKSIAAASREHQLHPNCIAKWRTQHVKYGADAFAGNGNAYTHEAKVAELERIIGQYAAENTLLKRALRSLEEAQRQAPMSPSSQRGSAKAGGSASK
jgi:transposase